MIWVEMSYGGLPMSPPPALSNPDVQSYSVRWAQVKLYWRYRNSIACVEASCIIL